MKTDNQNNFQYRWPGQLTIAVTLKTGEAATLRPLSIGDADRFAAYLEALSAETRARWGPHAFDGETARAICRDIESDDVLRYIATIMQDGTEIIVGYVLLKMGVWDGDKARYAVLGIDLNALSDCTLAPSVADAYQNSGIGSMMVSHLLKCAPLLGRSRVVLWGGVQATNERAIHFYSKCGFQKVGEFYTDKNNWDMILVV